METNESITNLAVQLQRRFDTRNPFRIAERLGIDVIYTDQLKRLKGMYRVIKRNRFIILNSKNSERMSRIVCAHELGHDQLHRRFAGEQALQEFELYDMSTRREYEANIFAAGLLLDTDELLEMIADGYDTLQIASATETDINLVALRVNCLIQDGYRLRSQEHNNKFLK